MEGEKKKNKEKKREKKSGLKHCKECKQNLAFYWEPYDSTSYLCLHSSSVKTPNLSHLLYMNDLSPSLQYNPSFWWLSLSFVSRNTSEIFTKNCHCTAKSMTCNNQNSIPIGTNKLCDLQISHQLPKWLSRKWPAVFGGSLPAWKDLLWPALMSIRRVLSGWLTS